MRNLSQEIENLSPEQRSILEAKLKAKGITLPQTNLIKKRAADQKIPLSFAQTRLWFVQQLESENNSYNVPCALKLSGNLDVSTLAKTLNKVVERHEILRTVFVSDQAKNPLQVVQPFQYFELPLFDLEESGAEGAREQRRGGDRRAEEIIRETVSAPFDLGKPLLRIKLLRLAQDEHILVIATHHIVSDRWSVGVFLKEIAVLYRAFLQQQDDPLPQLPIQYGDWSIWQQGKLSGGELNKQINYWQEQLKNLAVLELPSDRTRLPVPSYQGAKHPLVLGKNLSEKIKALGKQTGVTLFTLLLTAFKILLYRYSQQEDVVVGTDIANRDRTETESLIGLLVNTLVLRTDLTGNPSFLELLERVKQVTLDAFAHKDLSFEKLVEILNPERNLSQMMPLFQVKFDLQLAEVKPLELPELEVTRLPLEETTVKYELRFNLQNSESGISGNVEYSTDLFDQSTVARMVEHFKILLEGIVSNPQAKIAYLPIISTPEQELIAQVNNTTKIYPQNQSIPELFIAQAVKTANSVAVIDQERQLTYQELDQQSSNLAEYLRSLGVQPEVRVGICLDRSLEMILGLLAILKAGGAYVPLDPSYPQQRLDYIVADSQISILLTQTKYLDKFPSDNLTLINLSENVSHNNSPSSLTPLHPCPSAPHSGNLAYIIYTSGSSGKPKGVAISQQNTLQLLHWAKEVFTPDELSGVLAATSICFDLSVFEIFVPLSWGGTVILAENALELPNLPSKDRVKLVNTVPSAISALLHTNQIPNSVTTVNLAGESLKTELVARLYERSHIHNVYNLYGPSEDTTYSTFARLGSSERTSATIGKPLANTQAYVLDKYLQPVPIGVPGQLYLTSTKVARGYLNRPELTAESFIPNPFISKGVGLYKTGDLVKYLPDGNLEFLGRGDRQVKIRGYRLEIAEVETAINTHSEVKESVVVAQEQANLSQSLIAYIVPKIPPTPPHPRTPEPQPLRQFLTTKLPSYAIPTSFIELSELPLLPNGKIDRKALPKLNDARPELTTAFAAPQTETEKAIADIWQIELNLDQVGINDNFFDLGGHSLLGIKIVAYLSDTLGKCQRSLFRFQFAVQQKQWLIRDERHLVWGEPYGLS
ncbi:MAG: amino acid adenylation domain-containing protein, partial [Cyanobacteria bacterium J06642_3]